MTKFLHRHGQRQGYSRTTRREVALCHPVEQEGRESLVTSLCMRDHLTARCCQVQEETDEETE